MPRLLAAAALLALAGCGGTPAAESPPAPAVDAPADAPADSGSDDAGSGFVVLPGTGTYAIGADAPFGGYQLVGEPDALPGGCTWSIEDETGAIYENNGLYVFLTDIPEAVTFVTNGCPDWEQFE